ncbi:MAG: rhomboid family intramembrane serine protease [Flavobacteriaceae bacterium]
MTFLKIKEKLQSANIVETFIYINLGFFLVAAITHSFVHLQQGSTNFMLLLFAFDANNLFPNIFTFITYGFLHLDFIHILFNLIALYYIGNLFTAYFSDRNFVLYYVLGSIFGALAFLASFHYFPVFNNKSGVLIGASAGVTAIIVGLATHIPNYEMNFRFIGYVKLWVIAAFFVVMSIILIKNGNEGGQIAHLGGAFIGFILTKFFYHRITATAKQKNQKTNLKTVYKAKNKSKDFGLSNHQKGIIKQQKIDALLDKISKSGYETLSQEERDFLASVND